MSFAISIRPEPIPAPSRSGGTGSGLARVLRIGTVLHANYAAGKGSFPERRSKRS